MLGWLPLSSGDLPVDGAWILGVLSRPGAAHGGQDGHGEQEPSFATAIALAQELKKGVIDRLRSMPMARSAVLTGRLARHNRHRPYLPDPPQPDRALFSPVDSLRDRAVQVEALAGSFGG